MRFLGRNFRPCRIGTQPMHERERDLWENKKNSFAV